MDVNIGAYKVKRRVDNNLTWDGYFQRNRVTGPKNYTDHMQ